MDVLAMSKGKLIGLYLFFGGIILLILYGLVQFIQEVNIGAINIIIGIGVGAVLLGVIILLLSIIIEQSSDMKKRKQEIKKEDFEP